MRGTFAGLGEIMQLAYLPSDFDAAIRHWTEAMGAGPFFSIPNVALEGMTYLGAPTNSVFSMALGYWGDVQIELIHPENDAPSIYTGEYGVYDRLHHVCVLVDDIAAARAVCVERRATIVVEAKVGDDGAVLYVDPGTGPGNLVEILQPAPGTRELFAMMREAHRGWDGSEPVRSLG